MEAAARGFSFLLHEKHLPSALDRTIKPTLIMRGQTGVFLWKNTSLVGNKLLKQVGVLKVEGVDRKIDLGLWPRGSNFRNGTSARAAFVGFIWACFARHRKEIT